MARTLCRISELTREDLEMIAKKSFSEEHWFYAEEYINQLLNRQESYQEALKTFSKSKKQKHSDMASATVTPLKYFAPPETIPLPLLTCIQCRIFHWKEAENEPTHMTLP